MLQPVKVQISKRSPFEDVYKQITVQLTNQALTARKSLKKYCIKYNIEKKLQETSFQNVLFSS